MCLQIFYSGCVHISQAESSSTADSHEKLISEKAALSPGCLPARARLPRVPSGGNVVSEHWICSLGGCFFMFSWHKMKKRDCGGGSVQKEHLTKLAVRGRFFEQPSYCTSICTINPTVIVVLTNLNLSSTGGSTSYDFNASDTHRNPRCIVLLLHNTSGQPKITYLP